MNRFLGLKGHTSVRPAFVERKSRVMLSYIEYQLTYALAPFEIIHTFAFIPIHELSNPIRSYHYFSLMLTAHLKSIPQTNTQALALAQGEAGTVQGDSIISRGLAMTPQATSALNPSTPLQHGEGNDPMYLVRLGTEYRRDTEIGNKRKMPEICDCSIFLPMSHC